MPEQWSKLLTESAIMRVRLGVLALTILVRRRAARPGSTQARDSARISKIIVPMVEYPLESAPAAPSVYSDSAPPTSITAVRAAELVNGARCRQQNCGRVRKLLGHGLGGEEVAAAATAAGGQAQQKQGGGTVEDLLQTLQQQRERCRRCRLRRS
jgi:hypothetical protein